VSQLPDLREHIRTEAANAAQIIVARGGPANGEQLRLHAERVRRAFVFDGNEVLGISVYGALDDLGPASLDAILGHKLGTYRWVHLVSAGELRTRGFELLATFERPHFTVLLPDLDTIDGLVDALGAPEANPRYGHSQRRVRRRPR
jgi:hypothetical protein